MGADVKPLRCRFGFHKWRRILGQRHWHVQCARCGRREVWRNMHPAAGYQPVLTSWPRPSGPKEELPTRKKTQGPRTDSETADMKEQTG